MERLTTQLASSNINNEGGWYNLTDTAHYDGSNNINVSKKMTGPSVQHHCGADMERVVTNSILFRAPVLEIPPGPPDKGKTNPISKDNDGTCASRSNIILSTFKGEKWQSLAYNTTEAMIWRER